MIGDREASADFVLLPGPWLRAIKGRYGLIVDPSPCDGPPCPVCQEPSDTHRTGWVHWVDDDGRIMAGAVCFADIDQIDTVG